MAKRAGVAKYCSSIRIELLYDFLWILCIFVFYFILFMLLWVLLFGPWAINIIIIIVFYAEHHNVLLLESRSVVKRWTMDLCFRFFYIQFFCFKLPTYWFAYIQEIQSIFKMENHDFIWIFLDSFLFWVIRLQSIAFKIDEYYRFA